MTDTTANDEISNHLAIGNFFRCEYVKRHIEEYDTATLEKVLTIRKEIKSSANLKLDSFFRVIMKFSLEKYYEYTTNKHTYATPELKNLIMHFPHFFLFDVSPYTKYYSELIPICEKYNIPATEALYPTDMNSVLHKLQNKHFHPTIDYPFINTHISPLNTHLSGDNFTLQFSMNTPLTNNMSEHINKSISIARRATGKKLSKYEIGMLKKSASEDKIDTFRASSSCSRAIGLLMWDDKKSKKHNDYLQLLKLATSCGMGNCAECNKRQSCMKLISNAYKLTCKSIKSAKIESTTPAPNRANPTLPPKPPATKSKNAPQEPTSTHCLRRYPPDWP